MAADELGGSHSNIYARGYGGECTEADLVHLFGQHGEITSIRVVSGQLDGGSGGAPHCFVRYASSSQVRASSIAQLHDACVGVGAAGSAGGRIIAAAASVVGSPGCPLLVSARKCASPGTLRAKLSGCCLTAAAAARWSPNAAASASTAPPRGHVAPPAACCLLRAAALRPRQLTVEAALLAACGCPRRSCSTS